MTDTAPDPIAGRNRLARVYAEALMAAAADANQIDDVGQELDGLVTGVLDADRHVGAYLASPAVGRKAKTEAIAAALAGRASDLVRNFVGVLDRNGRLDLLRGVRAEYRGLLDKRAGRVRVTVTSAVPLADGQLDALTKTLADRLTKTPVVAAEVDPDLLGGLVVRVGDQVYDSSVRTRLETLRTHMMDKGASYVA